MGVASNKELMHPKYKNRPVQDRMAAAVRLVTEEGWSQSAAARHTGVSRSRVNVNVKKWRERNEENTERSAQALQRRIDALKEKEAELEQSIAEMGGTPQIEAQQDVVPQEPAETQPVIEEKRRVPPPDVFQRMYFGNTICPDCGVAHEIPGFHDEIMSELTDPVTRRLLINVAPYHAKSTVGTVRSTIYSLVENPNSRTAIISKSSKLAERFVGQIQRYLTDPNLYGDGPNLIEDWGPFYSPSQWSKTEFWIANRSNAEKDPSVSAYGVGTQIYGYRFDRMLFDDIADLENQRNPDRVAEMLSWATLEAASRVGKTGLLAFIGTRIGPNDIYSYLKQLPAYKVITYPCIIDETEGKMLWGEHFPLSAAQEQRESMSLEMFNLVYQNSDLAGEGATFPLDVLEDAKDMEFRCGMYESGWRIVLGVDPAGAGDQAGYTAMVVLAADMNSGRRFVVDMTNVKQMRAPQIKDQIIEYCERYPITEVRVETNGLQSQLFQYDQELINKLTSRGVRFSPHITHGKTGSGGKWDPQFGIESMGPMFYNKQVSLPYADINSRKKMNQLIEQFASFPVGSENPDIVMAFWFAEMALREMIQRFKLPAFDSRFRAPARIRRKRHVIDFGEGRGRSPLPGETADPQAQERTVPFVNVGAG